MIDLQKARELLKAAMETQGPDFHYSNGRVGCFYEPISETSELFIRHSGDTNLPEDDPRRITGCLIGVALDLAGETRHHGYPKRATDLYFHFTDMMDMPASEYFGQAQSAQDLGKSWGEAYKKAEAWAKRQIAQNPKLAQ